MTLLISRPRPEITPVVSVWSRPNGLPIASTFWPTLSVADWPIGSGSSFCGGASMCEHREVLVGRGADDLRRVGRAVVERDRRAVADLDDVEVRDDVAVLIPHEARAGALRDLGDVERHPVAVRLEAA